MEKHKRGDVREDGMVFWVKRETCTNGEYWITKDQYEAFNEKERKRHLKQVSSKAGHLRKNLGSIKQRAKKQNLLFDLDFDYLMEIAPDSCPVFNFPLGWGRRTFGIAEFDCPSLDRIVPELGYVKGNVMWLSKLANSMKQNATPEQLTQFANWILNK
jgi:hypothetical protein